MKVHQPENLTESQSGNPTKKSKTGWYIFGALVLGYILGNAGGGSSPTPGSYADDSAEATRISQPVIMAEPVTIVNVTAKVTESNNSWSKHAYRVTLRNSGGSDAQIAIDTEFLDKDGFVVDDDRTYNVVVPAGQEKTVTGYALIDAKVTGKVASVQAKIPY